jgi:hypothetical protein
MNEAWESTVDAILMIYLWGPLMLLALGAVWTLLIFGAWKITTIAKHITKRYYEKFICKIFMNNKNEK